jgi:hypothetical protein
MPAQPRCYEGYHPKRPFAEIVDPSEMLERSTQKAGDAVEALVPLVVVLGLYMIIRTLDGACHRIGARLVDRLMAR